MFKLYTADRTEELAKFFGEEIYCRTADPLAEEMVVVSTQGDAVYLNQFLAREYGIAAGLQMPFPQGCCSSLLRKFFPDSEISLRRYETLPLTMDVYRLLGEPEELGADGELLAFLGSPAERRDREHQLRRWQLSGALAELYQRYQLTRFDTLEKSLPPERWQGKLWQKLTAAVPAPVTYFRRLLAWEGAVPRGVPARLSVFGISELPRWYIAFFLKLADLGCEVNFFHRNCCRLYWSDVYSETECRFRKLPYSPEENPLLASWGKCGRELLELLVEAEGERPFGGETDFVDYTAGGRTLLHLVQQDILDCANRQYPEPELLTDGSLEIHDCPRVRREVETLRDRLLREFAAGTLEPHEVLIMAPDIDEYAPHIRAVFDDSPLAGKYTLAGRNPVNAASGFADLLTLDRRPLSLKFVGDWLADPVRLAASGIAAENWPKLLDLLKNNRIYWGLDAAEHEEFAGVSYPENTWREGLDRLLRQYAAGPGGPDGADWEELAPAEDLLADLGRLITLVQNLAAFRGQLAESRTEAAWMELFASALDTFFAGTCREETEALSRFRSALLNLGNQARRSDFNTELTAAVAADQVTGLLAASGGTYRFLRGRMTCCSLGPLRSVPAKITAVLGLSQGRLPGRDRTCGFDPDPERRAGERSRLAEDRYLFLETVLAAREKLWLFGMQTTPEGESAPPAGVVTELLHYLEHSFPGFTVTRHPVMPYDRRLFAGPGGSLDRGLYHAAVQLRRREELPAAPPAYPEYDAATSPAEAPLWRLKKWVKDPLAFFAEIILCINGGPADELPELEPTAPDDMAGYNLRAKLLTMARSGAGAEECYLRLVRGGSLLPQETGRSQFRTLWSQLENLRQKLPFLAEIAEQPLDFIVAADGRTGLEEPFRVTGSTLIYTAPDGGFRHIFLRYGRDNPGIRRKIRLEQEALRLQLTSEQCQTGRTIYVHYGNGWEVKELPLTDHSVGNPQEFWRELAARYRQAAFRPQLWLEETAAEILKRSDLAPEVENYTEKTAQDYADEKTQYWLNKLLPLTAGGPPGWADFTRLCLLVRPLEGQE